MSQMLTLYIFGYRSAEFDDAWNLELSPEDRPPRQTQIVSLSGGVDNLGSTQFNTVKIFCLLWFFSHMHRSHDWTDFGDLYVIQCLSMQVVPIWGYVNTAPHLWGQIAPKLQFWGHE